MPEKAMRIQTISTVMAVAVFLVGCGKQSASFSTSESPATKPAIVALVATPVLWTAMMAWQQGNKTTAINDFVKADWSTRPLFPSSSPLSLTETQFDSLSTADRQAMLSQPKLSVMMSQLQLLKQLVIAVSQAGRDAAARGDISQAQKYFTSVKQCGTAMESPDCLVIVIMLSQNFKSLADADLAKIGQLPPEAYPNTQAAKQAFSDMTGLNPNAVTDIYFDYAEPDNFFGNNYLYLRFTYPNKQWIQRFLNRFRLPQWLGSKAPFVHIKLSNFKSDFNEVGVEDFSVPSWWDYSTIYNLSECYGRRNKSPCFGLWIDRVHHYVYLNIYD